ncbi:MAG: DedA family protein [bacterium]
METFQEFIRIIVHLDRFISQIIIDYGAYAYLIVFLVIFAETGLVVTPFLPGDSLLFVLGMLSARQEIRLELMLAILSVAATFGNTVNYAVGFKVGSAVFSRPSKWIKREYLEETQRYFDRYGSVTIVVARFLPIIRTFAPFLAGVGRMNYFRFSVYNVVGCLLWVLSFTLGGYFFGNIPVVRENLFLFIVGIVILSVLPTLWQVVRNRRRKV